MERDIVMVYSQFRKGNSKINWRKSSRTRTGSIAFISEASRQGSTSVKMKMENSDFSCDPRSLRRSKSESTQGAVAILKEKKRSKVVYLTIQRQRSLFCGKLGKRD